MAVCLGLARLVWGEPGARGLAAGPAIIAWTDRPAVTGLITLLAAAGFVLARWDEWSRSISRFILIGQNFAHPPTARRHPCGSIRLHGQFYYRLTTR